MLLTLKDTLYLKHIRSKKHFRNTNRNTTSATLIDKRIKVAPKVSMPDELFKHQ